MTVRRLKTYASSQGYVYQYYFAGKHPSSEPDAAEYVFDVTSDRALTYPVRVLIRRTEIGAWEKAHQRALSDAEQYAAVKLRLFRAFDEVQDLQHQDCRLEIDAPFLEESLGSLGID